MLSQYRFSCFYVPLLVLAICRIVICQSNNNNGDTTRSSSSSSASYDFEYLDSDMKDSIAYWSVRGASIAFFDKVGQIIVKPSRRSVPSHHLCSFYRHCAKWFPFIPYCVMTWSLSSNSSLNLPFVELFLWGGSSLE